MIRLPSVPRPAWHTVDLADAGTFRVAVRQPTFAEAAQDHGFAVESALESVAAAQREAAIHRIRTTIVDGPT